MFEDSAFLHKLAFGSIALNKACIAVAPRTARRKQRMQMLKSGIDETDLYNWGEADVSNYIEAYDCLPPPIFIPLITFAQVSVDFLDLRLLHMCFRSLVSIVFYAFLPIHNVNYLNAFFGGYTLWSVIGE